MSAVEGAIRRIVETGKPAGILIPDKVFAKRCTALATLFTAVAIDVGILVRGSEAIATEFRASSPK